MARSMIVLVLLVCGVSEVAMSAIDVPFNELVNHPRRYNGKRVSVHAYVVTSCTHCGEFWASVKAARDSRVHVNPVLKCIAIGGYRRGYALPKWFARRLGSQDYDGYVRVIGRFEYVDKTRSVNALKGFGWYRFGDKQITDITELRPLGPPIPARIN